MFAPPADHTRPLLRHAFNSSGPGRSAIAPRKHGSCIRVAQNGKPARSTMGAATHTYKNAWRRMRASLQNHAGARTIVSKTTTKPLHGEHNLGCFCTTIKKLTTAVRKRTRACCDHWLATVPETCTAEIGKPKSCAPPEADHH